MKTTLFWVIKFVFSLCAFGVIFLIISGAVLMLEAGRVQFFPGLLWALAVPCGLIVIVVGIRWVRSRPVLTSPKPITATEPNVILIGPDLDTPLIEIN